MVQSAGLLLFRGKYPSCELLLAHPGGPFWKKKDLGAWSIPKGEVIAGEPLLTAALREFSEETGFSVTGDFIPLTAVSYKGGKQVFAWGLEQDVDPEKIKSNLFEMEWPPRSGRKQSFPEIDRASWFSFEEGLKKIIPAQQSFITELAGILSKK